MNNKRLEYLKFVSAEWDSVMKVISLAKNLRFICIESDGLSMDRNTIVNTIWRTGIRFIPWIDDVIKNISVNNMRIYHSHLPTYKFSKDLCDVTVYVL